MSSIAALLKLPQEITQALRMGKIAYTKAQAIAKVKDEAARKALLDEAILNTLSLSQIQQQIQTLNAQSQTETRQQERPLSQRLTQITRLVKKNGLESNPQKREQVEALIVQIEALLEPEM